MESKLRAMEMIELEKRLLELSLGRLVSLDKRRPALVLSPDYRNQYATDVIVVPCSFSCKSKSPSRCLLEQSQTTA